MNGFRDGVLTKENDRLTKESSSFPTRQTVCQAILKQAGDKNGGGHDLTLSGHSANRVIRSSFDLAVAGVSFFK